MLKIDLDWIKEINFSTLSRLDWIGNLVIYPEYLKTYPGHIKDIILAGYLANLMRRVIVIDFYLNKPLTLIY